MKEIKHVSFNEMILIPARSRFENSSLLSYCVNKPLNSSCEKGSSICWIILFNCEKAEEIPSLVEKEIELIQKEIELYSDKKILLTQLDFFSNLKKEIEDFALRHDAPESVLNIISRAGLHGVTNENVIFISGISSLVEV
jgi:hypothetical protein